LKSKQKFSKRIISAIILTSIYILLMAAALLNSGTGGISCVLLIAGCALNVGYMSALRRGNFYFLIIAGMVCISLSAIVVGIRQNDTHIAHHIVRAIFEAAVIWLFAAPEKTLSKKPLDKSGGGGL
jgi:hypothetical protein